MLHHVALILSLHRLHLQPTDALKSGARILLAVCSLEHKRSGPLSWNVPATPACMCPLCGEHVSDVGCGFCRLTWGIWDRSGNPASNPAHMCQSPIAAINHVGEARGQGSGYITQLPDTLQITAPSTCMLQTAYCHAIATAASHLLTPLPACIWSDHRAHLPCLSPTSSGEHSTVHLELFIWNRRCYAALVEMPFAWPRPASVRFLAWPAPVPQCCSNHHASSLYMMMAPSAQDHLFQRPGHHTAA